MLPFAAVPPLILFVALLLILSLHALAASGHFPREHRAAALTSPRGAVVLYGSMALAALCLLAGLLAAWHLIPWYAAVIGGGAAVLIAPLVLQMFPDRFVDGQASLVGFAALAAVIALLLVVLVANRVAPS